MKNRKHNGIEYKETTGTDKEMGEYIGWVTLDGQNGEHVSLLKGPLGKRRSWASEEAWKRLKRHNP